MSLFFNTCVSIFSPKMLKIKYIFEPLLAATTQISYFFTGKYSDSGEKVNEKEDAVENFEPSSELARYEKSVANKLGYFAVSRTRFCTDPLGNYTLKSTSPVAQFIYWTFCVNTFIKSVFLLFLITDYFGPVVFLDKIAALDYILCVGITLCGFSVWFNRYPIHEIMHAFWSIENRIFTSLGCPKDIKTTVEKQHWNTVWIHVVIVWVGCGCLVIQVLADPKYCTFTYSAFEFDPWWLRIIFCAHEFFFMMHPWNNNTVTTSLCTFQAISLSNMIRSMAKRLKTFYKYPEKKKLMTKSEGEPERNNKNYSIEKLIFDYKQLILITDLFNQFVAYKVLALHICSYCQFISDVFVAIQVLKLDGTGFMDVWFFLEDCMAGVYMIYRVYTFMSRVAAASKEFLRNFHEYQTYGCSMRKMKVYKKIAKSLKVVGLKLGPFVVTPMTVLTALDTFGAYYVCVALW